MASHEKTHNLGLMFVIMGVVAIVILLGAFFYIMKDVIFG